MNVEEESLIVTDNEMKGEAKAASTLISQVVTLEKSIETYASYPFGIKAASFDL